MAAGTLGARVSAVERETGLSIVIESDPIPGDERVVTPGASLAVSFELAPVNIPVTGVACPRCTAVPPHGFPEGVDNVDVALVTACPRVSPL
jgi:hypothetical protein